MTRILARATVTLKHNFNAPTRDATVHVRSVNVQKAKMQPTNVRPKQTLTDKKEV